jgi:hypothetical protein
MHRPLIGCSGAPPAVRCQQEPEGGEQFTLRRNPHHSLKRRRMERHEERRPGEPDDRRQRRRRFDQAVCQCAGEHRVERVQRQGKHVKGVRVEAEQSPFTPQQQPDQRTVEVRRSAYIEGARSNCRQRPVTNIQHPLKIIGSECAIRHGGIRDGYGHHGDDCCGDQQQRISLCERA